jgi:hypothetical protein
LPNNLSLTIGYNEEDYYNDILPSYWSLNTVDNNDNSSSSSSDGYFGGGGGMFEGYFGGEMTLTVPPSFSQEEEQEEEMIFSPSLSSSSKKKRKAREEREMTSPSGKSNTGNEEEEDEEEEEEEKKKKSHPLSILFHYWNDISFFLNEKYQKLEKFPKNKNISNHYRNSKKGGSSSSLTVEKQLLKKLLSSPFLKNDSKLLFEYNSFPITKHISSFYSILFPETLSSSSTIASSSSAASAATSVVPAYRHYRDIWDEEDFLYSNSLSFPSLFILKEWNELFHTYSSPSSSSSSSISSAGVAGDDAAVDAACYQENNDYYESLYYYQQLEKEQLKQKTKRLFSQSFNNDGSNSNSFNSMSGSEKEKKKSKTEKENEVESVPASIVVSPSLTSSVLFSIPIPVASHHPAAWNFNFSQIRPTLNDAIAEMKKKNEETEIITTTTAAVCSTPSSLASSSLPSSPAPTTVGRGRPPGRKAKSPKVKKGEKDSKVTAVSPSEESEPADHQQQQPQQQLQQAKKQSQQSCIWETIHPAFIRSSSLSTTTFYDTQLETIEWKELIPSTSSSSTSSSTAASSSSVAVAVASASPANLPLNLVQFSISILEQQIHELESCNLSYLCSIVKKLEREQKLHEVLRKKRKNLDDLYYKLVRHNESKICSRTIYPKQFPKSTGAGGNGGANTKRTMKQSAVVNNNDNGMRYDS